MANNIHISYDLHQPDKNYEKIIDGIKKISGKWAKIHYSYWYVKTTMTSAQVREKLLPLLDKNDSLYVVDATNNAASWHNIDEVAAKYIRDSWQG